MGRLFKVKLGKDRKEDLETLSGEDCCSFN